MLIKRFEGDTMREALAAVREAFGPDALILSTEHVRRHRGMFGLLGKSVAEVTAAIDREPEGKPAPGRVSPDDSWRALQVSRAALAPLEEELRSLRTALDRSVRTSRLPPSLVEEVAELRRAARTLTAQIPEPRPEDPASSFRAVGISHGLSRELGEQVRLRIDDGAPRDEALISALAARIEPKLGSSHPNGAHQLIVGAPGVGKTTTVVKETGWLAEAGTRIVSTDAHRYGGVSSLRAIAGQLGVPVDVATSPSSLARLARARRTRMLVDTPGRGGEDPAALSELSLQRAALGEDAQVQLVVSATTKECDLRRQLSRYRDLEPDALVVTHVDDSVDLGNVVNFLLEEATPPLAWLGSGQRVPDDFDVPDATALARRVLETCP